MAAVALVTAVRFEWGRRRTTPRTPFDVTRFSSTRFHGATRTPRSTFASTTSTSGTKRIWDPEDFSPPLSFVESLAAAASVQQQAARLLRDLPRQLLEHGDHADSRLALDDDDGIVVLAELANVVDPELVVFALGVE